MTAAMRPVDRLLLMLAALVAAWHIVVGLESRGPWATAGYTIAFGILLVADLLLIVLGFAALESQVVVILSTAIPVGLAAGLAAEFSSVSPAWIAGLGLLAMTVVSIPRLAGWRKMGLATLVPVHSLAGLWIVAYPVALVIGGERPAPFLLVGLGGALIGLGGLLLSFLKVGRPVLAHDVILRLLPGLLLLATAAFAAGFNFG